jgi:hypothetical protein
VEERLDPGPWTLDGVAHWVFSARLALRIVIKLVLLHSLLLFLGLPAPNQAPELFDSDVKKLLIFNRNLFVPLCFLCPLHGVIKLAAWGLASSFTFLRF